MLTYNQGQHNTASSGTWVFLHLAHNPNIVFELYAEQRRIVGDNPLTYETLSQLTLHNNVIKETLRLHSPIHSVMRKVKNPMPIPGTDMVVPAGHVLLAAPGVPGRMDEYFPNAMTWDPHRWTQLDSAADDVNDKDTVDYGYGAVASRAAYSPYLPFGAGRHRCIGETFAYVQLGAILATMVRLLVFEQIDPKAPVPKTDYSSMFSRPMHPAEIRWEKRQSRA
jgi:sterol 14alpha-demethylase